MRADPNFYDILFHAMLTSPFRNNGITASRYMSRANGDSQMESNMNLQAKEREDIKI